MEKWRSIDGWPYEISSLGRVRRTEDAQRTKAGRIRKLGTDSYGYANVCLSRMADGEGNVVKTYTVHRLVSRAFIGPKPDGHHVNHIDGDKKNNAAANLEYVTPLQNTRHAAALGLRASQKGEANPASRLTADMVRSIRQRRQDGETLKSLADEHGVGIANICNICKRRTWKHIE